MHLCQDEINALVNSLSFVEHLTRYVRHAWYWVRARAPRYINRDR